MGRRGAGGWWAFALASLLTLSAVAGLAVSPDPVPADAPEPPRPQTVVLTFQVTNPSTFPRLGEVVRFPLTLLAGDLAFADRRNLTVRNDATNAEVRSGIPESTLQQHPDTSVYKVDVVFQDDFAAGETKTYRVTTNEATAFATDMSYSLLLGTCSSGLQNGRVFTVTDGPRRYDGYVDNDWSGSTGNCWNRGVAVYYTRTGWPWTARSTTLVRIGGNQLTLDQANFQMGWGNADNISFEVNPVMVAVHLTYRHPYLIHWSPPAAVNEIIRTVDFVSADVTFNFYNDRPMVEAVVEKRINEKFYNHNGFHMEFTVLQAGQGNYRQVFGNPQHTVMTGNTLSPAWNPPTAPDPPGGPFDGIDVGNNSAPAFADLDGDLDMDLLLGSAAGTLYGYRNNGGVIVDEPNFVAGIPGPPSAFTVPALGDLTGDGLTDLVVGLDDGSLAAFRNIGLPTTPVWSRDDALVAGLDVGDRAAPSVANFDGDLDWDLVVGNIDGTVAYFRNGGGDPPTWTRDDSAFTTLNTGNTKKTGGYSTPFLADVDQDADLDFLSGLDDALYLSIVYFENTGTPTSPVYTKMYPAMFNNVRGNMVNGSHNFSVPRMVDIDLNGYPEVVVGQLDGTLAYHQDAYGQRAERHVNSMVPLGNGSYRFYYDQDGNDGPYVVTDYADAFDDYYVLQNADADPSTGPAVLKYVPDFARYAYRDRYAGDEFPWAGGNVSYYPFLPDEDGWITRGLIISRAQHDAATGSPPLFVGGSYLSQTGTAAGYIQTPMTSMVYRSREVMVAELPLVLGPDYTAYDDVAERVGTPVTISGAPPDLAVDALALDPPDPGEGQNVTLTATVRNAGFGPASDVAVEFFDGDPGAGGTPIGATQTIPVLSSGATATAAVTWSTTALAGVHDLHVRLDGGDTIVELDEGNNEVLRSATVTPWRRMWSGEYPVTDAPNQSLDPAIAQSPDGRVWVAYHTFTDHDNFDVIARAHDGFGWGLEEYIARAMKRSSGPSLASGGGQLWAAFSSNNVEWNLYQTTANAIYYWAQKFDLYAARHDGTQWLPPQQLTDATTIKRSHQDPSAVVTSGGQVWVSFRDTMFRLYEGGYQIDNIPYQEMNVTAVRNDGSWSPEIDVTSAAGSQDWWGGPAAVEFGGEPWVIYGSEIAQAQWDLFARRWNGAMWVETQITSSLLDDVRPAAAVDASGTLWVVWERWDDAALNRDIVARSFDGVSWSAEMMVTADPEDDRKPVVAAGDDVWVVWESMRTGNKDLFARRWNATGGWSPEFQVTTDAGSDEEPSAAMMADGTLWIAWETDRNGHGNKDIYAKTLPRKLSPRPPTNVWADLVGPGLADLRISWDLSPDDDGSATNGLAYRIETCSLGIGWPCTPEAIVTFTVPAGTTSLLLPGWGHGSGGSWVFILSVVDRQGAGAFADGMAAKWEWNVTTRRLLTVPLQQRDWNVQAVFAASSAAKVRRYDASDFADPWKAYEAGRGGDLRALATGLGFWIEGIGNWSVAGAVSSQTTVALSSGWNLIGCTAISCNLGILLAGVLHTRLQGNAPAGPYFLVSLSDASSVPFGEAWWVYATSAGTVTMEV